MVIISAIVRIIVVVVMVIRVVVAIWMVVVVMIVVVAIRMVIVILGRTNQRSLFDEGRRRVGPRSIGACLICPGEEACYY
jgi:hypothetical protein